MTGKGIHVGPRFEFDLHFEEALSNNWAIHRTETSKTEIGPDSHLSHVDCYSTGASHYVGIVSLRRVERKNVVVYF